MFVSVAFCVTCWPTGAFGKLTIEGLICTASCGLGAAFVVFASPAQPLTQAAPKVTTPSNAAKPARFFPLGTRTLLDFPLARSPVPIFPPSGRSVRGAEYVFDLYKKYWCDVQLRDRRCPDRGNIPLNRILSCASLQLYERAEFSARRNCAIGRAAVLWVSSVNRGAAAPLAVSRANIGEDRCATRDYVTLSAFFAEAGRLTISPASRIL